MDEVSSWVSASVRRKVVLQCKNEVPEDVTSKRLQEFIDYSGDLIYNRPAGWLCPIRAVECGLMGLNPGYWKLKKRGELKWALLGKFIDLSAVWRPMICRTSGYEWR